jgi:ABC-type glycerol-3-phosphate transport system permease component
MSVYARENLFDFDQFAYGSAASTLLFLVIALITITFILATRMDLEGKTHETEHLAARASTPSSRHRGAGGVPVLLRDPHLARRRPGAVRGQLPAQGAQPRQLPAMLTEGVFGKQILNSVFVATVVVILSLFLAVTAAFALSRIRFRGRGLLLLTVLAVSMFPQIAVLSGLFEVIRWLGLFNSLWA